VTTRRTTVERRRGRSVVAALLVGFVVITTAIIWRRGYGITRAQELRTLTRRRDQLRAERTSLERHIADLTGRARLGSVVERQLDMHVPADSQVVVLPAPAAAPSSGGKHAAP
jgi:cell division protein FtsL